MTYIRHDLDALRRSQRELWIERYQFCTSHGRYADRSDIMRGVRRLVLQFGATATRSQIAEVVDDDEVLRPLRGMIPTRVCEAIFAALTWRIYRRNQEVAE